MDTPAAQRAITLLGTRAIPIGHEVELTTYVRGSDGLLLSARRDELLTDLTTGVRYTPWRPDGDGPAPWERADARVEARVRGRVLACTIEVGGDASRTRLLLDTSPQGAYR